MPLQMGNTGKNNSLQYLFSFLEETNDAKLLLDTCRERLVVLKIQGLLPCNLKRTLGAPLPAKTSCRPGSLLVAYKEVGR